MLVDYLGLVVAVTVAVLVAHTNVVAAVPLPYDEYSYALARNMIKAMSLGGVDESVSTRASLDDDIDKEHTVELYLSEMKRVDLHETRGNFLAARPIERVLGDVIARPLYAELRQLPKGGQLHMHEVNQTYIN